MSEQFDGVVSISSYSDADFTCLPKDKEETVKEIEQYAVQAVNAMNNFSFDEFKKNMDAGLALLNPKKLGYYNFLCVVLINSEVDASGRRWKLLYPYMDLYAQIFEYYDEKVKNVKGLDIHPSNVDEAEFLSQRLHSIITRMIKLYAYFIENDNMSSGGFIGLAVNIASTKKKRKRFGKSIVSVYDNSLSVLKKYNAQSRSLKGTLIDLQSKTVQKEMEKMRKA